MSLMFEHILIFFEAVNFILSELLLMVCSSFESYFG